MKMPTIEGFTPANTGEIYAKIASLLHAIKNCEKSGNDEWRDRHSDTIDAITSRYFPSGSGFDSGSILDRTESTPDRLVIRADFHHMDENGSYDGWTYHRVIIAPSLAFGFTVRVTGRDKRAIKDYICDCFSTLM